MARHRGALGNPAADVRIRCGPSTPPNHPHARPPRPALCSHPVSPPSGPSQPPSVPIRPSLEALAADRSVTPPPGSADPPASAPCSPAVRPTRPGRRLRATAAITLPSLGRLFSQRAWPFVLSLPRTSSRALYGYRYGKDVPMSGSRGRIDAASRRSGVGRRCQG